MKANKTNNFIFVHVETESRKNQFIDVHARRLGNTSYGIVKHTHDLTTFDDLLKLRSYEWDKGASSVIFVSGIAVNDVEYVIANEIMRHCPNATYKVIS